MDLNNTTIFRPLAEKVVGATVFVLIIVSTIVGNSLVVLAVFTYRPLKKVQNLFIISLAVADLAVATLVMPYHVVQFLDRWAFSFEFCQAWMTFDILLCTSSILNLCAIALDRFWAIHDPINYANRRTRNLVLIMIFCVWCASALISVPPLFGWNDWSGQYTGRCQYTSETGFVIFSALGSFFIPFLVMLTVYIRIYRAAKDRLRRRLLSRSASMRSNLSRAASTKKKTSRTNSTAAAGPTPLELLNALQDLDAVENTGSANEDDGQETAHTHLSDQALISPEMFAVGLPGGSQLADFTRPHVTSPQLARSISKKIDLLKSQQNPEVVAPTLIQSANFILANGPVARQRCQRRSRYAKAKQSIKRTGSETSVSTTETMNTYFKERERISITKEKRAAKTLAIIMGAFVMCWFPFFTLYLIRPLCTRCKIPAKLFEAANWLGYVNSSINPVIYTIFNTDFRNAFRNLFNRCKPSNYVSKM